MPTLRSTAAVTGARVLGLGEALDHLDQVVRQTGRTRSTAVSCYLVTGWAGTGKSRALEAARAAAACLRIPAPSAAALLSDPEIPLRTLFRVLHDHCLAHLAGDRLARIRWVDGEAGARLDLLERLRGLLADLAAGTPLLIVIDDFHLADRSSASAVHHLVSELRGAPVLWLLGGRRRPADDGPDNFAVFDDLPVAELSLRPLGAPEIDRLYGDRVGLLPAALARRVHTECDGNAYLIETLIGLGRSAGTGAARGPGVPEHVATAVATRWLAGLSVDTRTLLRNASAFPGRIDLSLLGELTGQRSIGVTRSVEEAVAAGVLTGTSRTLRFRSELVRRSVHRSLSEHRRRTLADALRSAVPAPDAPPRHDPAVTAGLTEAELKVVWLVVTGMTNKSVARTLGLSPHTVDTHLRHAFVKLGVRSRTEMARTIMLQGRGS
ncbi:hypothetical protein GCM10027063_26740 [Promicromonospora xylanilytica]